MSKDSKLSAAQLFAESGWSVFPINEKGKTPLTEHGFKDASMKVEQIKSWWRQWPNANIGIATGGTSGLVVFDVDVKGEKDGDASAKEIGLASAMLSRTPSGGRHFYYKHPGGEIRSRTAIKDGIDIRADGGYVVAPPSVLPNGCYAWVSVGELPDLPQSLLDILRSPRTAASTDWFIDQGKRNDTLFAMACELSKKGLEAAEIQTVIQQRNLDKCNPPLESKEVSQIVESACRRSSTTTESRVNTADILRLIGEMDCELFTDGHDAYASLERNGHRETYDLDGPDFGELIGAELYRQSKRCAPTQSISDAMASLKGRAKYDGSSFSVALRSAATSNGYYIDLADRDWQSILVLPNQCSVIPQSATRFRRSSQSQELRVDLGVKKEALPDLLNKLLNIRGSDLPLVVAWILDAWRPDTAYPILEITGEQGSSKSTTQDRIRNLVDPSSAPLLAAPRNPDDIVIAARSNLVLSYNNLSGMKREFQDLLCSVSTGGSVTVRKLYSNYAAATVEIKRPIILNGIESVGTNPDFVDRVISIDLPRISEGLRRGDAELKKEFQELRAGAAGALLDLFAAALMILPTLQLESLPRMADFANLGEAICRVMNWPAFGALYDENRRGTALATLESSPVARALQDLMEGRDEPFQDTCKELYAVLSARRGDSYNWPQNERGLSSQLRRYAPVLRLAGLEVVFRERSNRGKIVCVRHVETSSQPSQPSQPTPTRGAA